MILNLSFELKANNVSPSVESIEVKERLPTTPNMVLTNVTRFEGDPSCINISR